MPLSEAAKEKLRRKTRDENGNVLPHIHERLKKAHEVRREKKRKRKEQAERTRELEKLKQEAEEARKQREIEDLKREIAATAATGGTSSGSDGSHGARKDTELSNEVPRQAGLRDQKAQGRAPAQAADPAQHGHHAGEKPPAPDGRRGEEVRGEESAQHAAPRPHEPSQPGSVRERGPDGDGGDAVGEVDKGTKDKIAAYAFPNAAIAQAAGKTPPSAPSPKPAQPAKPMPVNRVRI